MFSYGSGLASSMFSLELSNDDGLLERLVERLSDVAPRLERRIRVPAADFVDILKRNEETHHKGGSSDIPRLAGTASFDRLGVVCVLRQLRTSRCRPWKTCSRRRSTWRPWTPCTGAATPDGRQVALRAATPSSGSE